MKQTMRYISVLALLMCSVMGWADNTIDIVAPANGTVTANDLEAAASTTVTLTVTPAAGYYIEKSDITVVKTISADQAKTRTDPGFNEPIALTGDDPTDLSTARNYTFTMPADANYHVKITATFKARTSITAAMIEDIADQGYTGAQITPTVVVKDGTTTLVLTTDYTVSYGENINVATGGSVTVTGQSKYMGNAEKTFVITDAISAVTTAPTAIEGLVYNGNNQALITDDGAATNGTLHYSLDGTTYSTTIPAPKAAGSYTVYYKVVGNTNYADTDPVTIAVSIAKKDITISGIKAKNKEYDGTKAATLDYANVVYDGMVDGDALAVSTTGTFDGAELGEGKTVTLGTLTLGGTSVANYQLAATGQQTTTTADITQAVLTAATLNSKITLSSTSIGFTGDPVAPTVTIDGMTEGTDYDVKYKNGGAEATATKPTNSGTYTIVIVGKGNYTGEVVTNKTFQITMPAPQIVDQGKPVTFEGQTFYELQDDVVDAIDYYIRVTVALPAMADMRTKVTSSGQLVFSKGTDINIIIRNVKKYQILKFDFDGRIFCNGSQLWRILRSRGGVDEELISGAEYEVRTTGDMIFTLKLADEEAVLKSISLITPPPTAIEAIEGDAEADQWFDLNGRQISKPVKKGIYIRNGKKVIF